MNINEEFLMEEGTMEDIKYMREIDGRFNEVPDVVLVRLYLDWSHFFACSWHGIGRGEESIKYLKKFAHWSFTAPVNYVSHALLTGKRG